MRPIIRRSWLTLALLALLSLAAACGGDSDSEPSTVSPTATPPASDSTEASLMLGVESGADPVFWRSEDGFQSLQPDQAYKVVVRVTNGYEEETLGIVATRGQSGQQETEFEAIRAVPVGPEDPGSYYVFQLRLPKQGTWRMTALAGDDAPEFTVEVTEPDAPGY